MPVHGSTTARGYGRTHQRLRAQAIDALAASIAEGRVTLCPRCDQPMRPGQPLDLDHTDDRTGYRGLAHRSCNRRAGAEKRNARRDTHAEAPAASRDW